MVGVMGEKKDALVKELLALLAGGQAHASLEDAVKGFPTRLRGEAPHKLPYSAWQLVEHIRIAQHDILDFSNNHNGGYKSLKWPEDYWPKAAEPTGDAWETSLRAIREDRSAFEKLLTAENADLNAPFPWGEGQTLLREALLLADHAAYHTAEIIVLRRLLGCWK
jgi:uncharacterized damage-inducible protein DinB